MRSYRKLFNKILNGKKILIDGATGSEVERNGFERTDGAWLSKVCLSNPDLLLNIHKKYIESGAEVIISNTFGSAKHSLEDAGIQNLFKEINTKSVEIAVKSTESYQNKNVLVAGGISYWSWMNNHPNLKTLAINIKEQSKIMKESGVDLIMLEMMIDIDRMIVTLEECLKTDLPVWVGLSCNLNQKGEPCLLNGEKLKFALKELNNRNVPLVNIMHTEIEFVDECLNTLIDHWDKPIGVYAHSQLKKSTTWKNEDSIKPKVYAEHSKRWLEKGVNLIGGCCGLHNPHIKELKKLVSKFN